MFYNTIICFHRPEEENGHLSNWYLSNFVLNGICYTSMEQYMMHQKALLFGDEVVAESILKTNDVSLVKKYGRAVKNYNDTVWNGMRQIVVYQGLKAKFSQNNDLKNKLLNTKDAILAECAVHDQIWGIGLSMKNPKRFDISSWQGRNLLGFTLMKVREYLQKKS